MGWRKHGAPPGLVKKAEQKVADAAKAAARSVGKGLHRAIRVATEYAVHLHKDDKVPKLRAIQVGARAVLNTVKKRR
jgi:hypothetical protein